MKRNVALIFFVAFLFFISKQNIKIMKKNVLIISLLVVSGMLFFACGETKKDSAKSETEQQVSKEERQVGSSGNTENVQPDKTFLAEAPEAVEPEIKDYTKVALRCQIILLDDAAMGKFRKLTKPMALDLVQQGKMLVVRAENGAIFFVYNKDKTFGGDNLARFAANDYIGILGKTKYEYGLNIIFAEYIESSD